MTRILNPCFPTSGRRPLSFVGRPVKPPPQTHPICDNMHWSRLASHRCSLWRRARPPLASVVEQSISKSSPCTWLSHLLHMHQIAAPSFGGSSKAENRHVEGHQGTQGELRAAPPRGAARAPRVSVAFPSPLHRWCTRAIDPALAGLSGLRSEHSHSRRTPMTVSSQRTCVVRLAKQDTRRKRVRHLVAKRQRVGSVSKPVRMRGSESDVTIRDG